MAWSSILCVEQVLATSKIHIFNCEKFQDYGLGVMGD